MSHQLSNSNSVWLSGRLFDATGSYDVVWWAIIHGRINDRPVARLPAQQP